LTEIPFKPNTTANSSSVHPIDKYLESLRDALSLSIGKWTIAMDWAAAFLNTHVSAALISLSHSLEYVLFNTNKDAQKVKTDAQDIENQINEYLGQSVASFYKEEAFAEHWQRYDDMLWVVLEWLASIKFISSHSLNLFASHSRK
jgi:hypothetical protein